jgi:hypothetical protein
MISVRIAERCYELGQHVSRGERVYKVKKLLEDTAAEGCRLCQLFLTHASKDQSTLWSNLLDVNKERQQWFMSEYTISIIAGYALLRVERFCVDTLWLRCDGICNSFVLRVVKLFCTTLHLPDIANINE